MKAVIVVISSFLLLCSCSKTSDLSFQGPVKNEGAFTRYLIRQGNHYSEQSIYRAIDTDEMKFTVRFDSSAIYTSASSENQYDINKLFGFSDNGSDHHRFSARIGWRWSDHALRLFAYVYNDGVVTSKEIGAIPLGTDISCSIQVRPDGYRFYVNDMMQTVNRLAATPRAQGYQLYPYFGGDEAAPHDISIWIRE
ncbi:MAG TPA: hypothetical protein VFZ78_12260 [Flavisolibacter sp.]